MEFYIHPSVLAAYPHLKVGIFLTSGLCNRLSPARSQELTAFIEKEQKRVCKRWEGKTCAEEPKIMDWRTAYKDFGYKPSSCHSSVESLIRRLLAGKPLPTINPLVDLYNLISIKHTLPLGANDCAQVRGAIRLVAAQGGERFVALGSRKEEEAKAGEIIYRDEEQVLCKAWNYRESDHSKVTEESRKVCLVVEGLEHTTVGEIVAALEELKALVSTYCGGEGELYYLDAALPQLGEATLLKNRAIKLPPKAPDYHAFEAYTTRRAKLKEIRALGMDPYPSSYTQGARAADLQARYEGQEVATSEEAQEGKSETAQVAGRLLLLRPMGKNCFGQLQDESGTLQVMFNKSAVQVSGLPPEEPPLKFIEKKIDLGDILGIKGHLFRTQKGELTLFAKEVTLLCKALLPLPDKHKGLTDKGTLYKERWLDLITHSESVERFKRRSQILSLTRRYFEKSYFMEVETPILQNIYGGAEARPFVSELHALHQKMYLRIALEISLKKLIVGGLPRVFEIGKVFRNEGIDRTHNPEFTMLESYAAYWDYNDVMTFTENLFAFISKELYGTTQLERSDKEGRSHLIDLKTPWKRLSMKEAIQEYGEIDPDALSNEEMVEKLSDKLPAKKLKEASRGKLIACLFEKFAESHLIQPHHITDHPIETTPFCKLHRDPKLREERFVERFESFILGYEFCNAYTELNDPELQRTLLEEQHLLREGGDEEANPMDEEFIKAICQGMPPTGGLGIGIDRLTMLFTDAFSIRDVIYFPLMSSEGNYT